MKIAVAGVGYVGLSLAVLLSQRHEVMAVSTTPAKVEKINAFSAHADYEETTEWLKAVDTSRLKKLFLVHGEKDAQEFMTNYLAENGFKNVQSSKYGEEYTL